MDARYDDLVRESTDFFGKLRDEDFFSSKVHHLYFNGVVTPEKAQLFRDTFLQLNETQILPSGIREQPKPIVIHLNSPGGNVLGIEIFETIIFQARVPFCVLIEGLCASAATFLALYAPYRVMIDYSTYLIHDSAGGLYSKTSNTMQIKKYVMDMFLRYKTLLKSRTRLTDEKIEEFIKRDMLLTATECSSHGLIDRLLEFPSIANYQLGTKSRGNLSLSLNTFLKKTNFNRVSISLENMYEAEFNNPGGVGILTSPLPFSQVNTFETFIYALDSLVLQNDNPNQMKPIILQILPVNDHYTYPIPPIFSVGILYRIALIQRIGIPVVAYIEGIQNLSTLYLSLMCPNRIALKPAQISTAFTYMPMESGWKFIDQIYNTQIFLSETIRFGRSFSHLPAKFYHYLDKELMNITAEEQIKYGLIHHIMDSHPTKLSKDNLMKYMRMNHLTLDDLIKMGNQTKNKSIQKKKKKTTQKRKVTKTKRGNQIHQG